MNLDPAGSQCFYLETGPMFAGIRLNLAGREPAGTLRPGAEAERFVEELTRELLAIVRVGTGVPLVRQVHRSADLFQGPRLGELPDLLVEWNLEVPIGTAVAGGGAGAVLRVASPRLGELEMVNRYCRTGEHRIGGLLMVRGPGIVPGAVAGEVSVLDLAPTFAAFLGVAMPGTTGRVVPGLLDP